jgi:quercetin dioxygenase-like cupin family protein
MSMSENLMMKPLVPREAGHGWGLELFEWVERVCDHKVQRQMIVVAEGELKVYSGSEETVLLREGEWGVMDSAVVRSLLPKGRVRFFTIDVPRSPRPGEEVFDEPAALDPKYFGPRIDRGSYAVYDLVDGSQSEGKWSLALLEIADSPRHFHRIEKELFLVVHGKLDIEIDGVHRILGAGESVAVLPGTIHQLKSAARGSVRVLCFNFPAFDPVNMHCL